MKKNFASGFILVLILLNSCYIKTTQNERLSTALLDSTIPLRGNIITISLNEYRLDYYDVNEKDSDYKKLVAMGYQGGGYSWEGIIFGAIKLSDPEILSVIRFDPEAEGLVIWSNNIDALYKVGRLIYVIKTDDKILNECISYAKRRFKME